MPAPDRSVDRRRSLPQLQRLLEREDARSLVERWGHGRASEALRRALAAEREALADPARPMRDAAALVGAAAARLRDARTVPGRIINATGIVLHTNLGRAPLARAAIERMAAAAGYADLEFDLATGGRGARTAAVEPLLRALTGAPAALAVNNGAAAILLALSALAGGGEVIVSRGELVEIGGGFRIPDVIRQGGARLVEVGATNKVRLADYRAAIGPDTRVLLKVHQSNFRIVGFTAEVGLADLAALAREHRLLSVADLGSGRLGGAADAREPGIRAAIAAGIDLVTGSGDKLLGGPQAGLIVGTAAAVAPLRAHPLLRAVRLDKVTLAALVATLELHRDDPGRVPVVAMLSTPVAALRARAERLREAIGRGVVEASEGQAGGGSLPEEAVPSHAVALPGGDALAARLRQGAPPVVGRLHGGRLLLDMLAVSDDEVADLAAAVRTALG